MFRRIISVLIAVIAGVWFNYVSLNEAYGSGPPYYSRTTNMDKWVNPLPVLIPLNVVVLGVLLFVVRRGLKQRAR
jgi:hypothetical protein